MPAGVATSVVTLYLRLALGAAFLSAVADRVGLWGAPGDRNVAWGGFEPFLSYTATLNPHLPAAWIPALGWTVTGLEVLLGVALVAGYRIRWTGFASGALLLAFAPPDRYSVDALRARSAETWNVEDAA